MQAWMPIVAGCTHPRSRFKDVVLNVCLPCLRFPFCLWGRLPRRDAGVVKKWTSKCMNMGGAQSWTMASRGFWDKWRPEAARCYVTKVLLSHSNRCMDGSPSQCGCICFCGGAVISVVERKSEYRQIQSCSQLRCNGGV